MRTEGFSVGNVLKFGWTQMKEHLALFIGILILYSIFLNIPTVFIAYGGGEENVTLVSRFICVLYNIIVSTFFGIGMINLALRISAGAHATFKDFFAYWNRFFAMLFGGILYLIVVGIGFIFFIIPGVYLALRFWAFPYFIIDRNAGIIESFKLSGEATKGYKWDLFCWIIVAYLVVLLGVLCFLVGIFVACPIVVIGGGKIYRIITMPTHAG